MRVELTDLKELIDRGDLGIEESVVKNIQDDLEKLKSGGRQEGNLD